MLFAKNCINLVQNPPLIRLGAGTNQHYCRWRVAGFTLIEMIAVMVLVGLLGSIALPAMQRWFDSISARAQLSEVSIQFQQLAARAALLSQTVVINKDSWREKMSDGDAALALPDGWSITSAAPVTFFYSGICDGGNIDLQGPQQRKVQLNIAHASCDVRIVR